MVNPSLAYEVLMYFNTFFFGMVAGVEIFFTIVKAIQRSITEVEKIMPMLGGMCLIETTRIVLSKMGNLEEKKWQPFVSAALTIPCSVCVLGLALCDNVVNIEIIFCGLLLMLHLVEMLYVIKFLIQMRRPISYM